MEKSDLYSSIDVLPTLSLPPAACNQENSSSSAIIDSLSLLNNLTDLIIVLDKTGHIYFSNQNIFSWAGMTLQARPNTTHSEKPAPPSFFSLLRKGYARELELAFEKALKSGESISITGTIFNDLVEPADCHSLVINAITGPHPITLFVIIVTNITKQKSLQDNIYKSEQEKSLILNSLTDYVILQNTDSNIIWANEAALESAGVSATEIVGMYCFELWGNKKHVCSNCPVRAAIRTGRPQEIEHASPHDGIWILKGYPVRSQEGEIIGAVEIARNITESKQKERQLRLTQFSIDNFTEPVYWIAADASFVYVNQAAIRFLGYSEEEFSRLYVYEIDPSLTENMWLEFWERLKKAGHYTITTGQKKKNGQSVIVEITMRYLQFEGQEYCFAVAKDLTEHKLAEEKRQRLEEQLNNANRLETIGQLAASLAHDFSNLLTSIRTYSQLLLNPADNPGSLQDDVREIQRAIDHGSGLIQQLLSLGKKQHINPVTLNLNEFITNLQEMLRNILSRQISFEFIPGSDLDSISIDLHQLDQLLFNLAVNARDAMPQRGQFTIKTENVFLTDDFCRDHPEIKKGAYVKLTLQDTGMGIDEEIKNKIFEPFFTTKRGKGTGLGLAIVNVIVKQNNGLITIHSVKGQGTRFDMYFPALDKTKNEARPGGPEAHTPEAAEKKKSIMLAIDDAETRELVKVTLLNNNFNVLIVKNAEEALSSQKHIKTLDLMLTSYLLPTMNAFSIYEKMKFLHPQLKLIVVMEFNGMPLSTNRKIAGYPCIYKPLHSESLLQTINEALEEAARAAL